MKRSSGIAVVIIAMHLVGCSDAIVSTGGDEHFLRASGPAPTPVSLQEPLLPVLPGTRWVMVVKNPDGHQIDEEQVVRPLRNIDGVLAYPIEIRQQGKLYRTEYYQVVDRGIYLVGADDKESIRIKQPMPVVRLPFTFESSNVWQGTMRFRKADTVANAYSRVVTLEEVKVPAGRFQAYRVDTMLTATFKGQAIVLPATRWFVPGVGVVKHRFGVGQNIFVKEMRETSTP